MLQIIEKHLDIKALKEDCRKIGINFVTAGIVGVFINHFVGSAFSTMFWTSLWVTCTGVFTLLFGLYKLGDSK